MTVDDEKPKQIERDGQIYKLDKNGYYRTSKGYLMKGQNLAAMKAAKNAKKRLVGNMTAQELRNYINGSMVDIINVLVDSAIKDKDVASATVLINKVLPTLKSTELTGDTALPTLIINQLVNPQLSTDKKISTMHAVASDKESRVINSESTRVVDNDGAYQGNRTPLPGFSESHISNIPNVDNFSKSGALESTLTMTPGEHEELPRVAVTTQPSTTTVTEEGADRISVEDEDDIHFGFMESAP